MIYTLLVWWSSRVSVKLCKLYLLLKIFDILTLPWCFMCECFIYRRKNLPVTICKKWRYTYILHTKKNQILGSQKLNVLLNISQTNITNALPNKLKNESPSINQFKFCRSLKSRFLCFQSCIHDIYIYNHQWFKQIHVYLFLWYIFLYFVSKFVLASILLSPLYTIFALLHL